jgi:hypothetical protein
MRPLSNAYLHAAVLAGVAIQILAASVSVASNLLGNAGIPIELWAVVFGGAFVAWAASEAVARFVWRGGASTAS